MTHVFQAGDVVYVNELTPEIIEQRANNKYEFDNQIETLIGKHAVVMTTDGASSGIVGLVRCAPNYQFQLADAPRLDNERHIETVPAQVTLVRGSSLRTSRIAKGASEPFSGIQTPLIGDTIVGPISDALPTVTTKYTVSGVSISMHHVIMETTTHGGKITRIRFIPFKYFDDSLQFTTF